MAVVVYFTDALSEVNHFKTNIASFSQVEN